MAFVSHLLIPVASADDARTTCDALEPYLADLDRITAVHVIEKAGGAIDKAPLEKRQEDAVEFLDVVETRLGDRLPVDTEVVYGTDVVDALFDATDEAGADAIAFRARGGSRITRLLSGDTASKLVTDPSCPVIALPNTER